ncbi:MAG: hypothetical protein IJB90_00985 [Clostridia bacterium]|nr:hypothetical protein [Clostridia bacterium]
MMNKKTYEIIIGEGDNGIEAADALEKEVNPLLDEGHSANGAPFILSLSDDHVILAQCILRKKDNKI